MPETTAQSLGRLWREVIFADEHTGSEMQMLEERITAMEEVAAARWPRRWLLAARLRRQLRASVRPYLAAEGSFLWARVQSVSDSWALAGKLPPPPRDQG
jgi:hypothetical protein